MDENSQFISNTIDDVSNGKHACFVIWALRVAFWIWIEERNELLTKNDRQRAHAANDGNIILTSAYKYGFLFSFSLSLFKCMRLIFNANVKLYIQQNFNALLSIITVRCGAVYFNHKLLNEFNLEMHPNTALCDGYSIINIITQTHMHSIKHLQMNLYAYTN